MGVLDPVRGRVLSGVSAVLASLGLVVGVRVEIGLGLGLSRGVCHAGTLGTLGTSPIEGDGMGTASRQGSV